ncbi:IclR family transcriptional regulator [Pantoea sp. Tr-811]|uniref:IclR family transcriptional regulator n=1 Tax=Pantoea sp. Tr-811 TaxID=2608361 RepID=UPI001424171E|nr:IclR family transcriptional regulator [Pantoea sp. Tr-811]NIF30324.1 IclR family transcriptional regulator [Pantoea sp. Tr-811]
MSTPDDDTTKAQRAVQSIEVGGRLLLALAASKDPMTLKDLAACANLPSSRAHPYLVSYSRLGLVSQCAESGRYGLGPAALQMGLTALHQMEPTREAMPIVESLAADTEQAVAVSVWGNLGSTVIRMIDARQPLHVAMRPGTVMSTFGTATGRAFAAVLPGEVVARALDGLPIGDTGARTGMAEDFEAQLASAREEYKYHRCTRAVGKPMPGVNAFSAPVFGHEGQPVLVLTLLGHQDCLPSAWSTPMATALKQAAAAISTRLGYLGNSLSQ